MNYDKMTKAQLIEVIKTLHSKNGSKPETGEENIYTVSEEKFRRLSEAAFEGIVIIENGRILEVNQQLADMLDYKPEDLIGKTVMSFVPAECHEIVFKNMTSGFDKPYEAIAKKRDGTTFPVEIHGKSIPYENRTVRVSVLHDLSLRKKAEEDLKNSKHFTERIVHASPSFIYVIDIIHQKYLFVNDAYEKVLRYDKEKILSDEGFSFVLSKIHPEDLPRIMQQQYEIIERINNRPQLLQEDKVYEFEYRVIDSNGNWHWIHSWGVVFETTPDGQISEILGVAYDITNSKKAEQDLKESRERFELAIQGSNDGMWDWPDVNQDVEWWSPRWYELLGYDNDEIEANLSNFRSLIHPDDIERMEKAVQEHFTKRIPCDLEYRMKTKSGQYRWFRGRGQALWDEEGNPIRMSGSIQDIDERMKAEEALRNSESRFRSLIEQSPFSTVLYAPDGCPTYGNPAAAKLWDITPKKQSSIFKNYNIFKDEQLAASGLMPSIQKGFAGDFEKMPEICYDPKQTDPNYVGPNRWIRAFIYPVKDDDGTIREVVLVHEDVTQRKKAEEDLQMSYDYLDSVIQNLPAGLAILEGPEFRYFRINQKLADMNGLPVEAHINKPIAEVLPGIAKEITPTLREVFETGSATLNREFSSTNPKDPNKIFHFMDSIFPIKRKDGKLHALGVVVLDITDRKNTENKLIESERKYRTIFENVQDVFYRTAYDGKITEISPSVKKYSGYTREELIGKSIKQYYAVPEDYEKLSKEMLEKGEVNDFEIRMRSKDNRLVYVSVTAHLIYGIDNNPIASEGSLRDITERKLSEKKLKQAKAKVEKVNDELQEANEHLIKTTTWAKEMAFKAEVASAAKGEFLANMSHEIRTPMNGVIGMANLLLDTELNDEQLEYAQIISTCANSLLALINDVLDFSKIEAGKLEIETIEFDLRKAIESVIKMLVVKAREKGLELQLIVKDGIPTHIKGDPGRLRQILVNYVNNAIKFTEYGKIEVVVELINKTSTHAKICFSVIDSGIGISKESIPTIFDKFIQVNNKKSRSHGGTGLGLAICKQLTELMGGEVGVTSEEGKGSTFWSTIDLEKKVDTFDATFQQRAEIQGCRVLVVDRSEENKNLLESKLTSFGCSVQKAGDNNSAIDALNTAVEKNLPFDFALICAQWPLMNGSELGRLIKSNDRLNPTILVLLTASGFKGEAQKMKEIGYAAYLTMPIEQSNLYDCLTLAYTHKLNNAKNNELITRHSLAENNQKDCLRILVAEDNKVNRMLALRLLEKLGHKVDVVENGKEAVDIVGKSHFDLILMDCNMPEMDGYEATASIRAMDSECKNIPIIAITGYALKGDKENCIAAGMDGYVSKPIKSQELFAEIERLVNKSNDREMVFGASNGNGEKVGNTV